MKYYIAALMVFAITVCQAQQKWRLELFAGTASYSGDLNESSIELHTIRPSVHLNLKYELLDQVTLRGGIAWGMVAGDDKYNTDSLLFLRNLSFQSHVFEVNACVEFALLPPDLFNYSYPYVFAGVGLFHFNPFAKDDDGNKVLLKPLSTEGEGLPEYPNRKEYKLTQLCIPFGAGFSFAVNETFDVSFEVGFRKIFTDYLDDVSTRYVDYTILKQRKGQKAVDMAYRGKYPSGLYEPAPPDGTVRGNPEKKDWYFFTGLKIAWVFNSGE